MTANHTNTRYIIRYAKPSDTRTILKLGREAWPEWSGKNTHADAKYTRYAIKNRHALVTEVNGKIIGYAFFGIVWNYMHLLASYVKPEYRKEGIGSAQMERRIEIAREMGLKKVLSDCDVDNKVAYKYHIKNGFVRCGYIKRLWDREDSFVLSKDL
ncbi:MAG: GNAT family N-acetyltransferase [Candidatus Micrarchaeota archaeon]|nr:GNAT family N-acetyltransferase [Candidatus Micrarchaeota archaeon]